MHALTMGAEGPGEPSSAAQDGSSSQALGLSFPMGAIRVLRRDESTVAGPTTMETGERPTALSPYLRRAKKDKDNENSKKERNRADRRNGSKEQPHPCFAQRV